MFVEVPVSERVYEIIKNNARLSNKTISEYINDELREHIKKLKLEEEKKRGFKDVKRD